MARARAHTHTVVSLYRKESSLFKIFLSLLNDSVLLSLGGKRQAVWNIKFIVCIVDCGARRWNSDVGEFMFTINAWVRPEQNEKSIVFGGCTPGSHCWLGSSWKSIPWVPPPSWPGYRLSYEIARGGVGGTWAAGDHYLVEYEAKLGPPLRALSTRAQSVCDSYRLCSVSSSI